MTPARVVVVGAGIAGLATAYELRARGIDVRVLESTPAPGGVIRTDRFDGWVVDGGPDAILTQKPAGIALCRELGIADRLVPTLTPRTAFVLKRGRLRPLAEGSFLGFPLRLSSLARTSLFSPLGKLRMACEPLVPPVRDAGDESIASFVRRRFGREATDYLAEPLLAGIHAGDAERLSVTALFPRLVDAERTAGSVLRAFRGVSPQPSPQGAFVSFPGGIAELVEALVARLGDAISTSTRVIDLQRAGSFTLDTSGGSIVADAVVLAVPAYAAGAILKGIHTRLASLCADIPYASTATVALGYRRDQIGHAMKGSGFVVPRVERSPLLAGTWVTSKWPGRAPADHVLLRGFLGGGRDPNRLDAPDSELVTDVERSLAAALRISGPPVFSRLYRWTRQSPQYEVGHLTRLRAIEALVETVPGLFLTGSGFRAIGIPDCVADGRATAASVATYLSARSTPP